MSLFRSFQTQRLTNLVSNISINVAKLKNKKHYLHFPGGCSESYVIFVQRYEVLNKKWDKATCDGGP